MDDDIHHLLENGQKRPIAARPEPKGDVRSTEPTVTRAWASEIEKRLRELHDWSVHRIPWRAARRIIAG